jgi:homoserine dehydrogenase
VCQILKQNAGLIAARCGGRAIELTAVADIVKPEGVDISGATWYDDAVTMAKEADVDVVVETIGGYGVALTCVALRSSQPRQLEPSRRIRVGRRRDSGARAFVVWCASSPAVRRCSVPRIAEESLGLGKSVVTANKAMLALHGPRLAALAEENNATIGAQQAAALVCSRARA